MKDQKTSRTVRIFHKIANIPLWIDYDRMRAYTLYLKESIKRMFIPQRKKAPQSFEKTAARFNLDEKELLMKQKALLRLSKLMVLVALGIFIYSLYQAIWGSVHASFFSFVLSLISLTFAFRYHFWFYQIKHRRLGCSFKEWYRNGLLGGKDE